MSRKQYGMRLDQDLVRRLDKEAKRYGVPRTVMVEALLEHGLENVPVDRLFGRVRKEAKTELTGPARVEAFRRATQR